MNRRHRRNVAIGAVAALAAAGGGVAYAATSASDPQDQLLNNAAQRLNVRPQELRDALAGAFGDQLDAAVKDGKLTQEQADDIKQRVKEHGVPLGGFGGPGGPDGRGGPHGPFLAPGFDAAAAYLGLTEAQLRRRLASGDSLADVARAEGKSVDGLEQALVAAAKTQLDRAVADGKLTDAQRDEGLKQLQEHVGDLVAGKRPDKPTGPGPMHGHDGPGFGGSDFGGPGAPPPPFRDDDGQSDSQDD